MPRRTRTKRRNTNRHRNNNRHRNSNRKVRRNTNRKVKRNTNRKVKRNTMKRRNKRSKIKWMGGSDTEQITIESYEDINNQKVHKLNAEGITVGSTNFVLIENTAEEISELGYLYSIFPDQGLDRGVKIVLLQRDSRGTPTQTREGSKREPRWFKSILNVDYPFTILPQEINVSGRDLDEKKKVELMMRWEDANDNALKSHGHAEAEKIADKAYPNAAQAKERTEEGERQLVQQAAAAAKAARIQEVRLTAEKAKQAKQAKQVVKDAVDKYYTNDLSLIQFLNHALPDIPEATVQNYTAILEIGLDEGTKLGELSYLLSFEDMVKDGQFTQSHSDTIQAHLIAINEKEESKEK
jgi:hypothetical protein